MARCLLGLGSNLGDRQVMLRQATCEVGRLSGINLLARSRWHETIPIGGPAGQGVFLNGALLVDCVIPAQDFVDTLLAIEKQLGRDRAVRWDARAIDIDLLLFGREVIESPNLSIPHPRMSFRKFVLEPAAEIAGCMVDPISGWTLSGLLHYLQNAPRYVAVASSDTAIAEWLAERLCQELRCPRLEKTFADPEGVGDSLRSATVEFNEWVIANLCRSRWENDKELVKRLPSIKGDSQAGVSPVVSAFWYDKVNAGSLIRSGDSHLPTQRGKPLGEVPSVEASILDPALVIMAEPKSKEKFWKKIRAIDRKKTQSFSSQLFIHGSSKRQGYGPMAQIRAEDPKVVIQEAVAAIRSIWPELSVATSK